MCVNIALAVTCTHFAPQGPPGTGKTFIGVKALQLLLSLESIAESSKPIIVMAYRNRALDHFLHMCTEFCDVSDIVRVGGHHIQDNIYQDFLLCTNFVRRIEKEVGDEVAQKLKCQYSEG